MPFITPIPLQDILNPRASLAAGQRMAEIGGNELLAAVKERTPVGKLPPEFDPPSSTPPRKPGTARDSIMRDRARGIRGPYSGWEVRVFTLDPIFPYIEWSTKPHLIAPKNKKALRFPIDGEATFARAVHHPGTTGQHPFSRGSLFVQTTVAELLQPELDRFARELVTV